MLCRDFYLHPMKKILSILVLLVVMTSVACKKNSDVPITPGTLHTVKYNVTGTGGVNYSVIYKDSTGTLISLNNLSSGWSASFKGKSGDSLYLSATNTNIYGTVYGSISIDNVVAVDSAGATFPHIEIGTMIP